MDGAVGVSTYPIPPRGTRLVLVSENLLETIGTRTADGRRLSFEWGEPDENGWYAPSITQHDDGLWDILNGEPFIEPSGRFCRKWWRLGWLSCLAVIRDVLTPERPA